MQEENSDLDELINNPFRTFRPRNGAPVRPPAPRPAPGAVRAAFPTENREEAAPPHEPLPAACQEVKNDRAERNHPLGLRVLSLEKDGLLVAKKLDDLRRIIEHQNERIRLLEEELEIFRKAAEKEEE